MLKDFGCATGLHLEKQTDFHFVRGLLTVMRWVILMGWRLGYYSPPPHTHPKQMIRLIAT